MIGFIFKTKIIWRYNLLPVQDLNLTSMQYTTANSESIIKQLFMLSEYIVSVYLLYRVLQLRQQDDKAISSS